jgi:hypothetical protein
MKWAKIILMIAIPSVCLLLLSMNGSAAITFAQTGAGTEIRLRSIDYTDNCSNAMYIADLSTNRPLDTRVGRTAIDTAFDDYTYALSPADSCFFNRTNFWVYVTAYTGFTSVTIRVNCTFINGTTANRSITVAAKGKYYPLNSGEYVIMSTKSMIIAKVGTGSISYTVNQSRWGVVYKLGNNSWKIRDAGVAFGVSTKSVNISFKDETIHFNFTGENVTNFARNIFTGAGSNSGISFKNCSVTIEDYQNMGIYPKYFIVGVFRYFNVSNSFLSMLYPNLCVIQAGQNGYANFEDVIMNHLTFSYGNVSLENVYMSNYSGFFYPSYLRYANDVSIKNSDYAVALSNTPIVIRDSTFENNKFMFASILANIKHFFIDCVSDNWNTIPTNAFSVNGGLNRSYTFNMLVVNSTSVIPGVSWRLVNVTGATLYSGISGAGGRIDEQTVSHSTWNTLNPVTPILHNPYRLNVTMPGYNPVEFDLVIDEKTNLTLFLSSGNGSTAFDPNTTGNWLYIAAFDISQEFMLISIFFALLYFWWNSEKIGMMMMLTMLIIPYDFVVIIVYLLPLYITDVAILLFVQSVFILVSIIVAGHTIDVRSKKKKEEKQRGE